MLPEQSPEQGKSRSPSDEVWFVREGEMNVAEIRSLGCYLYLTIFQPNPASTALLTEYLLRSDTPDTFQVGTLPGELLVEKFTEMYGLSLSVLRRLTNAASIEFAGTYLPKYLEQQKVWVDTHSPGPLDVRMFDQQVIEPAIRVSHSGIGAAIQDHRSIIRQALYVDHDLSIRFGDVAS